MAFEKPLIPLPFLPSLRIGKTPRFLFVQLKGQKKNEKLRFPQWMQEGQQTGKETLLW